MALNFEKYAQEATAFMRGLAKELNHPNDLNQTQIILRSVLHTLRDRITVSESLNYLAQLPMFLKAIYVDNWKYHEKPERLKNIADFGEKVKEHQAEYGENQFDWPESTEEIIKKTLSYINRKYVTEGEIEDIKAQLPAELEHIFG